MSRITFNDHMLNPAKAYWLSSFGRVTLNEGLPVSDAVFYEIDDNLSPNSTNPRSFKPISGTRSIHTKLDMGNLVYLSSGCIINKGQILIPRSNTRISISGLGAIKGRLKYNKRKRPFSDFMFNEVQKKKFTYLNFNFPFSQHISMYCLYQIIGNRLYILPCMEIIRFYFGVSSVLLEHIFLNGIDNDTIFRKDKTTSFNYSRHDGSDQLRLSKYMLNVDVKHIARIALTEEGHQAARAPGWSSRIDSHYPIGYFPFHGDTKIDISYLSLGIYPEEHEFAGYEARFVTRIHSCNRPFVKNGVEWTRDNDGSTSDTLDAEERNEPRLPEDEHVDNVNIHNRNNTAVGSKSKQHTVDTSRFKKEPKDELFVQLKKDSQQTKNTGSIIPKEETDYDSFFNIEYDQGNTGEIKLIDSNTDFPKKDLDDSKLKERHSNEEYVDFYNGIISEFRKLNNYSVNELEITFNPDRVEKSLKDDFATNFARGEKDHITKGPYWGKRKNLLNRIIRDESHSFYLLDILPRKGHSESFGRIQLIHSIDLTEIKRSQFDQLFFLYSKYQKLSIDSDKEPYKNDELINEIFESLNIRFFDHQFTQGSKHTFDRIIDYINSLYKANL